MSLDQIDTPALVVDLSVVEANVARMAALARLGGKALLPHVKSHKTRAIAERQLAAGAAGLTCQTLREAEMAVDAGATNILIPTPVIGAAKIARLMRLARRAHLSVAVDSQAAALPVGEAASRIGCTIDVLVEIDVGYHRCGVAPDAAIRLAREIEGQPGLAVVGVLGYEGHLYQSTDPESLRATATEAYDVIGQAASELRAAGFAIERVSVGASCGATVAAEHPAITEIRPGSYVFGDRTQIHLGAQTLDDCALHVHTTVLSVPESGRLVLDAGSKSLSFAIAPGEPGYGVIHGWAGGSITRLSDEHATVLASEPIPFAIGDAVRVLPNAHADVVGQFDEMVLVRSGAVVAVVPIEARGR